MEAIGLTVELVTQQPQWQAYCLGQPLRDGACARLEFRRLAVRRIVAAALCVEIAFRDGADLDQESHRTLLGLLVRVEGVGFEPTSGSLLKRFSRPFELVRPHIAHCHDMTFPQVKRLIPSQLVRHHAA